MGQWGNIDRRVPRKSAPAEGMPSLIQSNEIKGGCMMIMQNQAVKSNSFRVNPCFQETIFMCTCTGVVSGTFISSIDLPYKSSPD